MATSNKTDRSLIKHYQRFFTRWRDSRSFRREKITVIFSPHLDDAFLSLYEHISSGALGKNIVCVNFFTASDSLVDTKTTLSFASVAKVTRTRSFEELEFSEHLSKKGINYLPVFLGMQDAALSDYYKFIASSLMRRIPRLPIFKNVLSAKQRKHIENEYERLHLQEVVKALLARFGKNIDRILIPMGVGEHIDHILISKIATRHTLKGKVGVYCDIPYAYYSGYTTAAQLHERVPKGFDNASIKKFDSQERIGLFRKLYPSQYDKGSDGAIEIISKMPGEVVFWRNR
ncbi:MAG: PIG-L family deacetylase [Candidatus Micrarchaeota archaeon]|nr:PIG-L family deacetylase [Candidatus Micrarchaeota archaeon]